MTPPRFGVNHVPSKDWMFQWMDIQPDAIRADFSAIAALGLDHVRVFPLWPVLQPNRTMIRPRALDDIATVVDIGAEFGLGVTVDVIQGHMSGFDFVPAWLVNWHDGNMFTDPAAVAAQADLVTAVHERVRDRPNYLGLTLGNELNQFQPPNPAAMAADSDQVAHWLTTLLEAPRIGTAPGTDGSHLITHSENDQLWYSDSDPFLPVHASRLGDLTTVHSWIFNDTAARYGGLSEESVHHGEWMIELSRAFADDPARRIWLQEVGAPSLNLTDGQMPEFCERTVRAALTTQNLYGITWWCSHDVSPDLADFKDLEYTLGLLDVDNNVKPLGRRFAEVVAEARREPVTAPTRTIAVVVDVDADDRPLDRSALGPGGAVFERWHRLRAKGTLPAMVTSSTAADPAALRARGITELVN